MEVVVTSDQVKRLSKRYFDALYLGLTKHRGYDYDEVFADGLGNPRIAVNRKFFESPTVYILKEDYDKFKEIIPLMEREFALVFKEWFQNNYYNQDFNKLIATSPKRMLYVKPTYQQSK